MTSSQVESQCKEVTELKTQFQQLQQEIITKLKEYGSCIYSAEKLNQEAGVLVRNLADSLANVSNDEKEWQQIRVKLASTAVKGKVVLDVGGDKYSTSVETLTRENNSFFTAMFSRQWELERDPVDKSIFIDRDGKIFTYILEYLRTEVVSKEVMANETLRQRLILETRYFHLYSLLEILTEPERKEAERIKNLFSDGTLLSEEQRKTIHEFVGTTYTKSELLYKASRDGFDANAFHTKCNNQGATITIIRSTNGYLFGGYTSTPWLPSNGTYSADSNAFLFTLTNPHSIPPTKYPIKPGGANGLYHHVTVGPIFGEGHDLHVVPNSNSAKGSNTSFPYSYTDSTGQGKSTFTGSVNFMTTDIEVFKLT